MLEKYLEPEYKLDAFNCPHCGVYAHQKWYRVFYDPNDTVSNLKSYDQRLKRDTSSGYVGVASGTTIPPKINMIDINFLSLSKCERCDDFCFWKKDKMVYPFSSIAPLPVQGMPDDVKEDFLEASKVVELSPRSSAALLRLALQKLMKHLDCDGKNINDDIQQLVENGLSLKIQKSLDIVRVIGNESVHPGMLDLKDDKKTAAILFRLLNLIVFDRIIQPKQIDELYGKLPPEKLRGIEERDKKINPKA